MHSRVFASSRTRCRKHGNLLAGPGLLSPSNLRVIATSAVKARADTARPLSLSELIAFESELEGRDSQVGSGEALIDRAARVLEEAKALIAEEELRASSSGPSVLEFPSNRPEVEVRGPAPRARVDPDSLLRSMFSGTAGVSGGSSSSETTGAADGGGGDVTRDVLRAVLEVSGSSSPRRDGDGRAMSTAGNYSQPDWAVALFQQGASSGHDEDDADDRSASSSGLGGSASPGSPFSLTFSLTPSETPSAPQRQQQPQAAFAVPSSLQFAELEQPAVLQLLSQEEELAARARTAVLPPLQSVLEMTTASRPPVRGDMESVPMVTSPALLASSGVAEGKGKLKDGTRYEKLSGVDTGANGYTKRWTTIRGITGDGKVVWEETVWNASDRLGLRELGAYKTGNTATGAAWREEWAERLYTHAANMRLVVERTAHKWARDEASDEWEEKWGEYFEEAGRVTKWAEKWAKADVNVWHEKWGEDYDGKGYCQKYTDKWAERLLPGGNEQWGDKWCETFAHGRGTKHGEVWSSNSWGSSYNRWWNEEHFGEGRVRKWGNSTSGEYWDHVEHMDTYYNPIPHFGFHHAVSHSPDLWKVPLPPPEENGSVNADEDDDTDGLGAGLGRL